MVFGALGEFQKTGSQLSFLTFLTIDALNLLGSVNYFDQVGRTILQNRYIKTNFENTEIRDFVSTFWNFIMETFWDITYFLNLKCMSWEPEMLETYESSFWNLYLKVMHKITRSLMNIVNKIKRCKIWLKFEYFVLTFQRTLKI